MYEMNYKKIMLGTQHLTNKLGYKIMHSLCIKCEHFSILNHRIEKRCKNYLIQPFIECIINYQLLSYVKC